MDCDCAEDCCCCCWKLVNPPARSTLKLVSFKPAICERTRELGLTRDERIVSGRRLRDDVRGDVRR